MNLENKFQIHPLAQVGVFSTIIEDLDLDYWVNACYDLQKNEPTSHEKSNSGGWQSRNDLQHEKYFWPLVRIIQNEYSYLSGPAQPVTGMWYNVTSYTNWNFPHTHIEWAELYPYKNYSGVLYLKTSPECGNIFFKNPLNVNDHLKIEPVEKMMLLFPSVLEHYVEPNLSQEDRISISFNFNDDK